MGLFDKLKAGLTKTRDALAKNLDQLVFGERVLDQALYDELEELMISADMGPQFALDLIEDVKKELGPRGRLEVRYSGTEPLARIMIEGPDEDKLQPLARKIVNLIDSFCGQK